MMNRIVTNDDMKVCFSLKLLNMTEDHAYVVIIPVLTKSRNVACLVLVK